MLTCRRCPSASARSRCASSSYGPREGSESVHRSRRDLLVETAQREAAARVRGRQQRRDFIHVCDTARAVVRAIEADTVTNVAVNVDTGRPVTVTTSLGRSPHVSTSSIAPEVTEQYRAADIRHCWADAERASDLLGDRGRSALLHRCR